MLDYTLRNVLLGSAILGIVGGALGSFAILRRQSLMSDALAHAALPGIALAFMLTLTKVPEVLLLGAGITGWLAALAVLALVRGTRLKEDTALGAVLSVSFGFGVVLLTRIQHSDQANQSGLDRYLFGQAATLLERDVIVMSVLAAVALGLLALFFKEFKLLSFDRGYMASLGFPVLALDIALTSLIVLAVLIGLQTVGVVLIVAMLIAPAAAARQWTDSLSLMIVISGLLGAAAGCIGAFVSSTAARMPTGPVIVLAATGFLIISVFFAPDRGVVWSWLRRQRQRRRLAMPHMLAEIHTALAGRLGASANAVLSTNQVAGMRFEASDLAAEGHHRAEEMRRELAGLTRRGLVRSDPGGGFTLTDSGAAEAVRAARSQRLWRTYLAHQLDLPEQDVHLDFEDIERTLSPETVARLEAAAAVSSLLPEGEGTRSHDRRGRS